MFTRESSNEVCRAAFRTLKRQRPAFMSRIAGAVFAFGPSVLRSSVLRLSVLGLSVLGFTSDSAFAQSVELVYSQPSAGGGISTGGDFSLIGSVAQVAAGPANGGDFDVLSGFIPVCEFACVQGDVNCDGAVDADDLAALLSSWGACPGGIPCAADVNDDGQVNSADLAILLGAWG
ncbi:MAG: dockerin type I repeat-containing protein [bacterium]